MLLCSANQGDGSLLEGTTLVVASVFSLVSILVRMVILGTQGQIQTISTLPSIILRSTSKE